MTQSPIATAADYADAMLIARQVKSWLILLLLVMLAVQLALFFMARYDVIHLPSAPAATAIASIEKPSKAAQGLQYVIGLIDFVGIACTILLSLMLLLLVLIMLVGRLIGLSHVMAALVGSLIAAVLLFPWQAFLDNAGLTASQADFKIPGVLYTFNELLASAHFPSDSFFPALLKWSRFVVFPIVTFALLIWIHIRSKTGLRLALGEAEPPIGNLDDDHT